jgi:hypothetical protein
LILETGYATDDRLIICKSTIALQLMKVSKQAANIIKGIRTLWVSDNLYLLPTA